MSNHQTNKNGARAIRGVVGVLALLLIGAVGIMAQGKVRGEVYGEVLNAQTHEPILGAIVEISNTYIRDITYLQRTDAYGRFEQTSLSPGEYELRFSAPGFRSAKRRQWVRIFKSEVIFPRIELSPLRFDATGAIELPAVGENDSNPASTGAPQLAAQTGHSWLVESVAFSPDGAILASGSADTSIKLWDVAAGRELRTLTGHRAPVGTVVYSPDGKILASGSADGTIKLWDVDTGRLLHTLVGYTWRSLAFSPDGKVVASGSAGGAVRLWDADTGEEQPPLQSRQHNDFISVGVAFSPDGRVLADVTAQGIILWDVHARAETGFIGAAGWAVAFSPNSKALAVASVGSDIGLYNVTTAQRLLTFANRNPDSHDPDSLAFSPDGKLLGGADRSSGLLIWDAATGKQLRQTEMNKASALAFSPDGKMLAVANGENLISLLAVHDNTARRDLTGYPQKISSLAYSPDGKFLAVGSFDNVVVIWDTTSGTKAKTIALKSPVNTVAFSPDSKLLAGGTADNAITVWNVDTAAVVSTLSGYPDRVQTVAFSPEGRLLAGADVRGSIRLWNVATSGQLYAVEGAGSGSIAFSPDGKTFAAAAGDMIIIRDTQRGNTLRTFTDTDMISSIAYSPDGNVIASGAGSRIKLWDVTTGKGLVSLKGTTIGDFSVAFSPAGDYLAIGSNDKTVRIWDIKARTKVRTLSGHTAGVTSVAFSPDGKILASGSMDTQVKLWEVSTGSELASLTAPGSNDWLVSTPSGLFDGSPTAWNKILWRSSQKTFDIVPVEVYFNEFYYPGLLADIFIGKRPQASQDVSQKDRRQPELKLELLAAQDAAIPAHQVRVKVKIVNAPAGAQDVRLFRNGSLVTVWRGDVLNGESSVTLEATVPIVAGENKFTAYAFNHDNIKSSDAELTVTGADSLKRQGTAYVLGIGVNEYANPQYKLSYAVADAEDFAAEIKRQQESLKRYAKVEVISLSDAEATKANITQKLSELAKQVQPEDAVIVFFAGHGTAQGNQFYLIPHDLGYDGPRENLSKAGLESMLAHSMSDRELEKLFEPIDAGQLLLVIDACNSGQALEAEEKRRGPMNSKGLAQLAYEKGMYVLTAAQSYQAAQEAAKFGHGFLTYALVEEGLKQGAADREPKNGSIDIREWLNFATDEVPKMQEQDSLEALRGRGRYVVFVGDGTATRDGVGNGNKTADDKARDNVQRPRVFYRRELETNPFVVATTTAASRQ